MCEGEEIWIGDIDARREAVVIDDADACVVDEPVCSRKTPGIPRKLLGLDRGDLLLVLDMLACCDATESMVLWRDRDRDCDTTGLPGRDLYDILPWSLSEDLRLRGVVPSFTTLLNARSGLLLRRLKGTDFLRL